MIDILYVDDEDALLEICKIFLEMSGDLKVDTSSSVNDAFTMMKKNHYRRHRVGLSDACHRWSKVP